MLSQYPTQTDNAARMISTAAIQFQSGLLKAYIMGMADRPRSMLIMLARVRTRLGSSINFDGLRLRTFKVYFFVVNMCVLININNLVTD